MDFLKNILLPAYGIEGIAITLIALILLILQIVHYARFARIAGFRLSRRKPIRDAEPPVSVIVTMFSENSDWLETGLLSLLAQDYHHFEVVVVYVGNDDNFYADLAQLRKTYPHLKTTQIDYSPRNPISNKIALNVGIKAAAHECLIFTTTEALPSSEHWLSLMAKGFLYGDIVLGYCGLERKGGLRNLFCRKYRFMESLGWIAEAIADRPFGASRHNFGFTKSLYFGARGFSHLNMNVGEDDLFVQRIASKGNVSVVISPRARCTELYWRGAARWIDNVHRTRATRRFYAIASRNIETCELICRYSLFAATAAMIALLPLELKLAAVAILAIRYLVVSFSLMRAANRIGEQGIAPWSILFDLVEPLVRGWVRLTQKSNENGWR